MRETVIKITTEAMDEQYTQMMCEDLKAEIKMFLEQYHKETYDDFLKMLTIAYNRGYFDDM